MGQLQLSMANWVGGAAARGQGPAPVVWALQAGEGVASRAHAEAAHQQHHQPRNHLREIALLKRSNIVGFNFNIINIYNL